jgi:hypothetical protein
MGTEFCRKRVKNRRRVYRAGIGVRRGPCPLKQSLPLFVHDCKNQHDNAGRVVFRHNGEGLGAASSADVALAIEEPFASIAYSALAITGPFALPSAQQTVSARVTKTDPATRRC